MKKILCMFVGLAVFGGSFGFAMGAGQAAFGRNDAIAYEAVAAEADAAADPGGLGYELTAAIQSSSGSSVSAIFKQVKNSVVSINVKAATTTRFGRVYEEAYAGSGIVVKEDAQKIYILTNYHVIDSATSVTVSLDDARQTTAHFVGGDEQSDLAVIYVNKSDAAAGGFTGYAIAQFADSAKLEVGDMAIAVGNALGEGKSATLGIVSALEKQIQVESTKYTAIQTDAAINPGNSGGALVNADGKVIGVNCAKTEQVGVEGMGYAIPSNYAQTVFDAIMNNGSAGRAYLGISAVDVTKTIQQQYGLPCMGIYVNGVEIGSTAQSIGMKTGDIIVAFNGKAIETRAQLNDCITATKVGGKFTVDVVRNNVNAPVTLTGTMQGAANGTNF